MDPVERYARAVVAHRRLLLVAVLIATAGIGAGVTATDWELGVAEFDVDSDATEAQAYVDDAFETDERPITLLVVRGEDAVTRDGVLESMDAQEAIRTNETVAPTLADNASTVGIGNGLAVSTDPRLRMFGGTPSIDAKRSVLEGRTNDQFESDLERLLASDDVAPDAYPPASSLLPRGYEPGESDAAHLVIIVHGPDATDGELLDAQRAIEAIGDDRIRGSESFVVGQQLAFDRASQATADGFALVGPLLLVTVVVALAVAYRDPVDVLLTLGGLGVVLVWLAGFLGWTGIGISQLLVAVPCLVVGLGIDYSLHVVMRTREAAGSLEAIPSEAALASAPEGGSPDAERAGIEGLSGVAFAIAATTATTALGFLAGVASPIAPLREFAVASAFGIVATFVVFGAALPALRVERRRRVLRRGAETTRPTVGRIRSVERAVDAGRIRSVGRAVDVGRLAAVAVPVLVVVLGVGLAVGGAYGATTIDTSTDRNDFLPTEQPEWVASLPEPVRPAEYGLREQAQYVERTFDRPTDRRASVLVRGDATDPDALAAVERAHREEIDPAITVAPIGGSEPVRTPLSTIERIAAEDDAVAEAYADADTTGDGVPDRNVEQLFDAAFDADPAAMATVVERSEDGSYRSVRTVVTVREGTDDAAVTRELDAVAASLSAAGIDATATGEPVLAHQRATAILTTAVETFVLAFVAIGTLLTVAFRLRYGTWTLGLVTVTPVVLALAWLLGTMSLLSIPYNAETAIITGIALGLGTDYAIHVSDRFRQCRSDGEPVSAALDTTLRTTGGTLVASAATTAAAFGLLTATAVPPLRRFGLITALAVAYSFVAAVVLLPSLLTLWDRTAGRVHAGPDGADGPDDTEESGRRIG